MPEHGLPSEQSGYKQRCPDCDKHTSVVSNYCPRCGTPLREVDDGE